MSVFFDSQNISERIKAIDTAVDILKNDGLAVIPTDTVYGIAANAFSFQACEKLYKAKLREKNLPLPVLVGSLDTIHGLATNFDEKIEKLIKEFWPGGLSLILEKVPSIDLNIGNDKKNILLRMPFQSVALEILKQVGPLAVSSANISGQPVGKDIDEISSYFGEHVDIYLRGIISDEGLASTILDVSDPFSKPKILRQGAVSSIDIAEILEIPESELLDEFK